MEPAAISAIREGFQTSRTYVISADVFDAFVRASQDVNPLHVDDAVARKLGFPGKVMHGGILNAFISHFVGMHFPAGRVLLHAVDAQFKSPCHLDDEIRVDARVAHVAASVGAIIMDLVLTNTTRARVAAKAKVQVGLL
jgi:acyl dehydratase